MKELEAMTACARHTLWRLAANVLAEVQVASMRLDVVLFGASVGAYKQASMWCSAVQDQNVNLMCGSSGLLAAAGDILQHDPGMQDRAPAMVSAWQVALACVQGLGLGMGDECQRMDSRVLGAAMAACAKAMQWERALELLHAVDAKSGALDLVLCNTGMAACASGRSWRRALDLLQRLAGGGFRSDVVSLNTCMTACERADRWQGACELLSAARSHAQRLDSITFAAGTAACGAGAGSARWALAISMMASCQEQGVQVSAGTFGTVLAALSGLSVVGAREAFS
eukprot:s7863_g1.t5